MKIFLAEGRLGNQIFQYAFLKNVQKDNEKIIVAGFDELLNVFDIDDNTLAHISKTDKTIRGIVYRLVKPALYKLANLKIIGSIEVKYEKFFDIYKRESTEYSEVKGLFSNVVFVKLGFFQSEKFFDRSIVEKLKIKRLYLKEATDYLKPIESYYKVFVHIRRGDYKNYKVYGKNTLLPTSYYHRCIKWFLSNRQNCYFVFLSDEPEFVKEEFGYLENKTVSKKSYETDFAIMTLCNGAILSPSSFGWWGGYLMKNRDTIFAPRYWLGFESDTDYHSAPIADCMKEVSV